jgi:hypothetical protein
MRLHLVEALKLVPIARFGRGLLLTFPDVAGLGVDAERWSRGRHVAACSDGPW